MPRHISTSKDVSDTTSVSTRLIGIDFGSKRVGVAVSDETGQFAIPHSVLANDDDLVEMIIKICEEEGAKAIVIGESKDYAMVDNAIMKDAREFSEVVGEATGLPVHFELEFMSSVEAARFQGETDLLDASAAAIILQSYLDKQRVHN